MQLSVEALVILFPHFANTFSVKCNIFSELTQSTSLLFFRKKINENCSRKILCDNGKLKPNFVLKILFWGKFSVKSKTETKRCVENPFLGKILCEIKNWNQTLCWFFTFWKYNTAFNSGLKIWRVSGKSEMAQLFNLKFCVYLCWLGLGSSPQFSSRETLNAIYFPNLRRALRSYFFARKLMKIVVEKSCVIMEN